MIHLSDNLLAVPVPEDAKDFVCDMGYIIFKVMNMDKDAWVTDKEIERDAIRFITTGKSKFTNMKSPSMWKTTGVPLPPGKWTLVGTTRDISHEQARPLVFEMLNRFGACYKNYLPTGVPFKSARESLLSLIRSKGGQTETNYIILKNEK